MKPQPQSSQLRSQGWTDKLIRIFRQKAKTPDHFLDTQARCLGNIAVHVHENGPHWCVSSVTTGLKCAVVSTEEQARKVATTLHNYFADAFAQKTRNAIVHRLQEWCELWLRKCNETKTFVDPAPFRVREMG